MCNAVEFCYFILDNSCTNDNIKCADGSQCIDRYHLCDEYENCNDTSDEDPDICRGIIRIYIYIFLHKMQIDFANYNKVFFNALDAEMTLFS